MEYSEHWDSEGGDQHQWKTEHRTQDRRAGQVERKTFAREDSEGEGRGEVDETRLTASKAGGWR